MSAAALTKKSSNRVSSGTLTKYTFPSSSLGGLETSFNIFVPDAASPSAPVPVLYYLAGLTCTEDTGPQKGGLLNTAGKHGLAMVFPDTSPRGAGIEGEEDDWDFGTAAGFYLTATSDKWGKYYNMYELVVSELPAVLAKADLGLDLANASIMGHSMGGHGALSLYLKNPTKYKSASAFAPACNPSKTPWGIKAFSNYLAPEPGADSSPPASWLAYDSTHLLRTSTAPKGSLRILVDTGSADDKMHQLKPDVFEAAARESREEGEVQVRMQEGFDHSYYFVSTFTPEHVEFHAKFLKA